MRSIFASVCLDFESERVKFDGADGHVHLLVHYPPKDSVPSLVNSFNDVSSRMNRQNAPAFGKSRGTGRCGLRLALREIVAERLSKSSANTSNSKKTALAAAKDAYGVRAILPRPEE